MTDICTEYIESFKVGNNIEESDNKMAINNGNRKYFTTEYCNIYQGRRFSNSIVYNNGININVCYEKRRKTTRKNGISLRKISR